MTNQTVPPAWAVYSTGIIIVLIPLFFKIPVLIALVLFPLLAFISIKFIGPELIVACAVMLSATVKDDTNPFDYSAEFIRLFKEKEKHNITKISGIAEGAVVILDSPHAIFDLAGVYNHKYSRNSGGIDYFAFPVINEALWESGTPVYLWGLCSTASGRKKCESEWSILKNKKFRINSTPFINKEYYISAVSDAIKKYGLINAQDARYALIYHDSHTSLQWSFAFISIVLTAFGIFYVRDLKTVNKQGNAINE